MAEPSRIDSLRLAAPALLPSLLLCDFGNLEREVDRLREAGLRGLHLDVMDGQFVPNLTYGLPIVEALRRLTDMPLDVHLMISEPQRYVSQFADAGADVLTVHIEAVNDPVAVLDSIRERGLAAGMAINPDTPWESLDACVGHCDLVLVMSVPAGFGGQRFRPDALARLRRAREQFGPQVVLEVDGGVNADTIGDCVAAGAQWLVVGSAIFRAPRYDEAVRALEARW